MTGADGRYQIRNVPAGPRAVRATSIGYTSADTVVNVIAGQTVTVDFDLNRSVIAMDEIVVTGTAGAQEKITLGNSVGTIEAGQLVEETPIHNVMELLSARTPGLTLMSNSGQTGSSSNIRIRGAGSLNGGYQPVFYLDGVRIESGTVGAGSTYQGGTALDFLNPEDIESVEVLKGPAAATLYGADAANGVIQIITKKGRRGAESVQWTSSIEVGQNEWVAGQDRYTTYWHCTTSNQNSNSYPGCKDPSSVQWWGADSNGNAKLFTGIPAKDIIDVGDGTFILKDNPLFRDPNALRAGDLYDFQLSARGGTGRAGYYLSFNNSREQGVFWNNFNNRIGGRANFDAALTDKLDISTSFSYTRTHLRQPLNNNASNSINRNGMRGRARAYERSMGIRVPRLQRGAVQRVQQPEPAGADDHRSDGELDALRVVPSSPDPGSGPAGLPGDHVLRPGHHGPGSLGLAVRHGIHRPQPPERPPLDGGLLGLGGLRPERPGQHGDVGGDAAQCPDAPVVQRER